MGLTSLAESKLCRRRPRLVSQWLGQHSEPRPLFAERGREVAQGSERARNQRQGQGRSSATFRKALLRRSLDAGGYESLVTLTMLTTAGTPGPKGRHGGDVQHLRKRPIRVPRLVPGREVVRPYASYGTFEQAVTQCTSTSWAVASNVPPRRAPSEAPRRARSP